MKNLLMMSIVAVLTLGAFAAADNLIYNFRPSVDDCYADGTHVLPMESYALVWLPTGSEGVEFTADCKLVDDTKGKIMRVRRSSDEFGLTMTFQVDAAIANPCIEAGGNWAVYLLDTRIYNADGSVSLAKVGNGVTAAINSSVKLERTVIPVTDAGVDAPTNCGEEGKTMVASALPADMPQPRITGMELKDGELHVKVADTVPYVQYNLASGEQPDSLSGKAAKSPRNGDASGDIELVVPATSGSGFFRVNRN